jgi:hypothetical protein
MMKGILFAIALSIGVFIISSCDNGAGPSGEKGLQFTLVGQDIKTVAAGEVCQFIVTVKNKGSSPVSLAYVRKSNNLPDTSWSSSFCVGVRCVPPAVDSVESELGAGCTDTCLIDIQTGGSGTALVTFKMYDKADPDQQLEHTFTCTAAY